MLPEHDVVVFDEAHALEDVAAEWLGARIGVVRPDPAVARRRARLRARRTTPAAPRPWSTSSATARRCSPRCGYPGRDAACARADLRGAARAARRAACATRSAALAARLEGAGEECDLVARSAARLAFALERCLDADHDETVVWSERERDRRAAVRGADRCRPGAARGAVGSLGSAVLCSATLATGDDLGFVRRRLGIDGARELQLPSPFDDAEQALLYLPSDAPDPRAPGFERAVAEHVVRLCEASRGSALCLFTSHRALDRVHALAATRLRRFTVLRQGEAPRERLLERFRSDVALGALRDARASGRASTFPARRARWS